ncbi:MAG: glycosyltransferase [Nocardioides sp.]|nr:glycosyltransferase [Nocardioides sp.]
MRILLWHVHGSWTTSFVQGGHDYLLPALPDRGPDGLGRALTWEWPASVREVAPADLAETPYDVVVLQRPHEIDLVTRWSGRRPGVDVPAVYVEHNTPTGDVPDSRHPLADQQAIPIVHVSGFNDLMWDCGSALTAVVEHGVLDPGSLYTGELPRAAVAVNDPVLRGRSVGADLLPRLAEEVPLDVFGMRASELPAQPGLAAYDDHPQHRMHAEIAQRRVYVHLSRWTSLGLSLIEAMMLGMPVVALGTTEAPFAVPPEAGAVTTHRGELAEAVRRFLDDRSRAAEAGAAARRHALARFGLERFLAGWDAVLSDLMLATSVSAGTDTGTPW